MDIERKAFYNLVRMHWLADPGMDVEEWQVRDWRSLSVSSLLTELGHFQITLDRTGFVELATDYEGPEELAETLSESLETDEEKDQVYLIVFELWRHLLPDQLTLSLFCDALDHQIYLYDTDTLTDQATLQDLLADLEVLLQENLEEGELTLQEVLQSLNTYFASDLERFLYDFIREKIEEQQFDYATDLTEAFAPYATDPKWFSLLQARLEEFEGVDVGALLVGEESGFQLEVLSCATSSLALEPFFGFAQQLLTQLETEEELAELLTICTEYAEFHGHETLVDALDALNREPSPDHPIDTKWFSDISQLFAANSLEKSNP